MVPIMRADHGSLHPKKLGLDYKYLGPEPHQTRSAQNIRRFPSHSCLQQGGRSPFLSTRIWSGIRSYKRLSLKWMYQKKIVNRIVLDRVLV